jgi:hypothetical protein
LSPLDRSAFLVLLAARLRGHPVLGDGLVSRIARETFREFWHAPDFGQPGTRSKYR